MNPLNNVSLSDTLAIIGLIQVNSDFTVIKFIRWLRGRKITRETDHGDRVIVETEDSDSVSVPKDVLMVSKDTKVRKTLRGATKPLELDGIDKMIFIERETGVSSELLREDAPYFEIPETVDEIPESEIDVFGRIDRPSIQGNKTG